MTGFQSSWIPNQQQFRHNPRSIVVYSLQTHTIMTSVYWRFSGPYPVLKINVSAHINWRTVFHVTYAFNMSLNHGKTSSHWWQRVTFTWRRWSPCTRRCLLRIFMLIDMGIFCVCCRLRVYNVFQQAMCDERDKSNASFTDNGGNVLHLLLHRSTTLQFVCPIRQIDTSTLQSLAASRILIPCFSTLKLKRLSCCEIYISCVFFRSPVFARLSVVFSVSRHDLELWQNALAHKSLGYTTRGYINPRYMCGFKHNGFHVSDTVTFVCVYDLLISYKFRNMSSFCVVDSSHDIEQWYRPF